MKNIWFFVVVFIVGFILGYHICKIFSKKTSEKIFIENLSDKSKGIITKTNESIAFLKPKKSEISNRYETSNRYEVLYNEFTNMSLSVPVMKRQGLEWTEFSIYKQEYFLPLSFPRYIFGAGIEYNFSKEKINPYFIIGYRFYENFGINILASINEIGIGIFLLY